MENYKPYISGVVSVVRDDSSSQKVKILRDTGATQSLMLDRVLQGKFEEKKKAKGEKALMRNEYGNVKENILGKQEGESKSVISRQNLIEEQTKIKIIKI